MPATVSFAVITPGEVKFEGMAEIVVAPGASGDLGALPNHAPMLTTLRVGVVRATVVDGGGDEAKSATRRLEYAVDGGFMQILPDRVLVLTDRALAAADVDVEAARRDLHSAESDLAAKRGTDDAAERAAAAWARVRLEVARSPAV
jgi:F-type H+-transporting ATPase subunit epsilon